MLWHIDFHSNLLCGGTFFYIFNWMHVLERLLLQRLTLEKVHAIGLPRYVNWSNLKLGIIYLFL